MNYPKVKNAHIVPRMYLLNFAVNEKITVHLVEEKRTLPRQPVENVGTRRYFYRRSAR